MLLPSAVTLGLGRDQSFMLVSVDPLGLLVRAASHLLFSADMVGDPRVHGAPLIGILVANSASWALGRTAVRIAANKIDFRDMWNFCSTEFLWHYRGFS